MFIVGDVIAARYRLDGSLDSDLLNASTFAGRDLALDRPVRVTILTGQRAPAALAAAQRAAKVTGPHLPQTLDAGVDEVSGAHYLITTAVRGQRLDQALGSGLLTPAQARAVVGEVATTLAAAAEQGIHHGTLRPACLYLDGAALQVTGLGYEAELVGTAAPEADLESEAASARDTADTAALGYFALTGRWAGNTLPPAALRQAPPLPASLTTGGHPQSLETLVPHLNGSLATPIAAALSGQMGTPQDLADALEPWEPLAGTGALSVVGLGSFAPRWNPPGPPAASGRIGRPSPPAAPSPTPGEAAPRSEAGEPPWQNPNQVHQARPVSQFAPVRVGPPAPQAASAPRPRRRLGIRTTPIVLPLVLAAVALGAWWAHGVLQRELPEPTEITSTGSPEPDSTDPATAGEPGAEDGDLTPSPEPTPATAPPVIASAVQIGPAMDCSGQQPEQAPLAIDGDPTTYWHTCRYQSPNFGGLALGAGLVINLREPATVSTVILQTNSTGGHVQIRQTTAEDPGGGLLLAEGRFAFTTVLELAEPTELDSLVVWITELPPADDGFLVQLAGIAVE